MGNVELGNEFEQWVAELRQRQYYLSVWRRQLEPSMKLLSARLRSPRTPFQQRRTYNSCCSRSAVLTNSSGQKCFFTIPGSRVIMKVSWRLRSPNSQLSPETEKFLGNLVSTGFVMLFMFKELGLSRPSQDAGNSSPHLQISII
jgi:hypothetical protein